MAKSNGPNEFVRWNSVAASASEFVVAIGLGALLGWGVDKWLDTAPWGLILGVGLGFALGLFILIRLANKTFKD